MPIHVTCQCGTVLKVGDELAGKQARCPTCLAVFAVPAAQQAPAAAIAGGGGPARGRFGGEPLDLQILDLIRSLLPQDGLFVEPDVPPKKLANATRACALPPTERVLAVIDCTVFGSAKNCLVFGCEGIYFHNDRTSKSAGAGAVPYHEFDSRVFDDGGFQEVALGEDQFLNVSGSSVSKAKALDMLQSVKQLVSGPLAPGPEPFDQQILSMLRSRLPQESLLVEPDIPPKKLASAAGTCALPSTEHVLGIIDCTVFGSAKNGLVFGRKGIYFHNDWGSKSAGTGAIPYRQFPAREFGDGGFQEVALGHEQFLNISGSSVSKAKAIGLLRAIRELTVAFESASRPLP